MSDNIYIKIEPKDINKAFDKDKSVYVYDDEFFKMEKKQMLYYFDKGRQGTLAIDINNLFDYEYFIKG